MIEHRGVLLAAVAALAAVCAVALAGRGAEPAAADQSTAANPKSPSRYIAGGYRSTCAIVKGGWVRCWGFGKTGSLGLGHRKTIGDTEHPKSEPRLKLGAKATAIAGGGGVFCALQQNERVRCWGGNGKGELGYGHTKNIGDNEHPKSVKPLKLGGKVKAVTVGGHQACAILTNGSVRCWGENSEGQLGYRNEKPIGDNEHPKRAGPVKLGGKARAITSGNRHVCVILAGGSVRCWGLNALGQLGYGHKKNIGDNEHPASAGDVQLGEDAVAIESEGHHTCALLASGSVRCWGWDLGGNLGYVNGDNYNNIGDDETPDSAGPVDLGPGRTAESISVGITHTCAALDSGDVRCWGDGYAGTLGYGNNDAIGDDESPGSAGPVELGGTVVGLGTGLNHTCAILTGGSLRCWGSGGYGQLGYNDINSIGDDETPASVGPVKLGDRLAG